MRADDGIEQVWIFVRMGIDDTVKHLQARKVTEMSDTE
jgi:hypothetical protein